MAQRFFEAGLCRLGREDDFYRELTLALLMQGNRPQVDIRPHLAALTQILVVAQPARRESGVDLLAQGLRDARIAPADLAGALAARIEATEAGFAPLDQVLASLCVTGAAGQAAVWLALEQVVADGLDGFSARKQSLLLDRLAGVLEEIGHALHDPAARQALEVLAVAKKKSVARDKARVGRAFRTVRPTAAAGVGGGGVRVIGRVNQLFGYGSSGASPRPDRIAQPFLV